MVLPRAWNGFYQKKNRSSTLRQRKYIKNHVYRSVVLTMIPMTSYDAGINTFDTANVRVSFSFLDLISLPYITMIRYIPMGDPKLFSEKLSNSTTCHATRSWSWRRYVYLVFTYIIFFWPLIDIGIFYGRTRICDGYKFWWQWWICQSARVESKGMKYTTAHKADLSNFWSYIS